MVPFRRMICRDRGSRGSRERRTSLRNNLDPAVGPVTYPAQQPQLMGLVCHLCPQANACDLPREDDVGPGCSVLVAGLLRHIEGVSFLKGEGGGVAASEGLGVEGLAHFGAHCQEIATLRRPIPHPGENFSPFGGCVCEVYTGLGTPRRLGQG